MKIKHNCLRSNKFLFVIFPILYLLGFVIISFIFIFTWGDSFTSISYNHNADYKNESLQKSNKNKMVSFKGSFISKANFIGTIFIKFNKNSTPVFDNLLFRIKEKGSEDWLVENNYDTRHFYYLDEYPFGFPTIEDSNNREYQFELIYPSSIDSKISPLAFNPVITKYQYSSSTLLTKPNLLYEFLSKKINYSFTFETVIRRLIIYMIPLLVYILLLLIVHFKMIDEYYMSFLIKFTKKYLYPYYSKFIYGLGKFVVLLILFNSMVMPKTYDVLNIITLCIWGYYMNSKSLSYKSTFYLLVFLSFIISFFLLLNFEGIVAKLIVWIYYFLVFGIFHVILEARQNKL